MRDLESDPELALPIGVTKRKTLARTRQRLAALIKDRDSAAAMAEELDQQARLDDALRTAAAQGDADRGERLSQLLDPAPPHGRTTMYR